MKRIVVLISGRGSNMEAMLKARLPVDIAAVISNEPAAGGLVTAQALGIATAVVPHRAFADRTAFDAALAADPLTVEAYARYAHMNDRLHALILEASGNRALQRAVALKRAMTDSTRSLSLADVLIVQAEADKALHDTAAAQRALAEARAIHARHPRIGDARMRALAAASRG